MVITFESRKKSYPVYVFVFSYALSALIFQDRWQYLIGLVMALILFLGSYGLGKRLSFMIFKTADQSLYFPIGLGIVLVISYCCALFSTSRPVFYSIWGILAALSAFELPVLAYRLNRNYFLASPLILLAFWSSFTPSIDSRTLEYFLGMPHQYLAIGKIVSLQHNLYSSLAPFGNTMTLLFSSMGMDCGVKAFSLILYFQIISIVVGLLRWLITEPVFAGGNGRDHDHQTDLLYMTKMELLVFPMLLFPGLFVLFHNETYDVLTAVFFCAAIASVMKEYEVFNTMKILNIGLLLSFALWTKTSALAYIPWIVLLWFGISGWRLSRENLKIPGMLIAAALLFWLVLPVRNAFYFGDPFYPMLSGIRSEPNWSPAQSLLFERLVMGGGGGLTAALTKFVALIFRPEGTGIAMVVSLVSYPFSRKVRVMNQILFFALGCYFTWFLLFQEFRHFLPVYVLLFPICYFAFRHLYIRYPKYLWIVWAICIFTTIIPLLRFFSVTPLIQPGESQEKFLALRLDYYPVAMSLRSESERGGVLLLGDSRVAYYRQGVLAGSPFDSTQILPDLGASANAEELYKRLRRQGIHYVVLRNVEFESLYGPQGIFHLTDIQMQNWHNLLNTYTQIRMKSGSVQLLELTSSPGF